MPKQQASLSVDIELWKRTKNFFNTYSQFGSVSSFFEHSLIQFLDEVEPLMEAAKSGNNDAVLQLFKQQFARQTVAGADVLADLRMSSKAQDALLELSKPMEKKGTVKRRRST